MNSGETKINHDDAEILIQVIDAQVLDADCENAVVSDGFGDTGLGDHIVKFVRNSKNKTIDSVKSKVLAIAEAYGSALKETTNRPDEFEIELSFSISTKGDVCIVSSESQAMMKVTMKWQQSH